MVWLTIMLFNLYIVSLTSSDVIDNWLSCKATILCVNYSYNETKKHCNCYCIKHCLWGWVDGGLQQKSAIHTCHTSTNWLYNSMPVSKCIDTCYFLTLPTRWKEINHTCMWGKLCNVQVYCVPEHREMKVISLTLFPVTLHPLILTEVFYKLLAVLFCNTCKLHCF